MNRNQIHIIYVYKQTQINIWPALNKGILGFIFDDN